MRRKQMTLSELTDRRVLNEIAERAVREAAAHGLPPLDAVRVLVEVSAVHNEIVRLRLDDLLAADTFNFFHDVFGIQRHLDIYTGTLTECFRPRFAA